MAEGPVRRVVLVGGGHSHALVLRAWAKRQLAGAQVTLVADTPLAPYSGMLPGTVAGHYSPPEMHIDLALLCRAAGARLHLARAEGIDRAARRLLLDDGSHLGYDLLSLNVGAAPRMEAPGAAAHAVPVKPISGFQARWEGLLARVRQRPGALAIAVVGAGAAGVELVLALQFRLSRELHAAGLDPARLQLHLVGSAPAVLPTHPPRVQRRLARVLAGRGVALHLGRRVEQVDAGGLTCAGGHRIAADEVLWVTQAGAAGWLATTGLPLDDGGFVRVERTLRSVGDATIFAAGDVAAVDGVPLEKAGVVAVRQAPVLAANIARALSGLPLVPWRVQRHWLALISTGDRCAVASRGPFSASGTWAWHWKDHIDRRFMRQFQPEGLR